MINFISLIKKSHIFFHIFIINYLNFIINLFKYLKRFINLYFKINSNQNFINHFNLYFFISKDFKKNFN